MIDAAGGWPAVLVRLAAVTAMIGVLGAWVFSRFVLPRAAAAVDDATREAWKSLAARVLVFASLVLAASAWVRLRLPYPTLPDLEAGTRVHVKVVMQDALNFQKWAALVVAWYWSYGWKWRDLGPYTKDILVVVLTLSTPFLAHAGAAQELYAAAVVVDLVHGLAAGAWIGALALVVHVIRRAPSEGDGLARATALFAAFHPIAVIAAPAVFATGLATAWLRMGVPEGIANPTYSGLFVAKLLLAGVTGYFGAGHSKLATKKNVVMELKNVRRTLAAEIGFAMAVLVLTALLLGTPPIG